MQNPSKFAGVSQTCQQIPPLLGRSSPYCEDIWGRRCCLTHFFPIVDTCLTCEDIARQSCAMVPRWRILGDFLGPVFPASRAQHISELNSKAPFTRYNMLSNRLSNRFHNRLYRVYSRLSIRLYNPVWQPVVSCKRGLCRHTICHGWDRRGKGRRRTRMWANDQRDGPLVKCVSADLLIFKRVRLRAIYVRHKTSHRRKSRVNGGTRPTEFVLGDEWCSSPRIQLTTRYAVYLYLFAQGIIYYTAFNIGSVWSRYLEWLPEYQNPQKSLCLTQRVPRPTEESTALTSQSHTLPCSIKYRYMNRQKFRMLRD